MIRIVAPHFVAGVILHENHVIRAAPIVKYMVGWNAARISAYCIRKNWAFTHHP